MKHIKAHQLFVRQSALVCMAVVLTCLLSGNLAQAQPVNLLKVPFTDAPGRNLMPSDTSLGGANVSLTMYNATGVASDFHGCPRFRSEWRRQWRPGTVFNQRSLYHSTGAAVGAGQRHDGRHEPANAADYVLDSSDAALGFGDITNFVVTMWVQPIRNTGQYDTRWPATLYS